MKLSKDEKELLKKRYKSLKNTSFAFFGNFSYWPQYHIYRNPSSLVKDLGAKVCQKISDDLDYVVFGRGRIKGKADAERLAKKLKKAGAKLKILDEGEFLHLVRLKIKGASFAFVGGFSTGGTALENGPKEMVEAYDAIALEKVTEKLNFLVVGDGRGAGKAAFLRQAKELNEKNAKIITLDETTFVDLMSSQKNPKAREFDFPTLILQLRNVLDPKRIDRAIKMLKKESFKLFFEVSDDKLLGIVKSQTQKDRIYSSWICSNGKYSCCDENLESCMGLQGKVCKHIVVLLLGICHNGELEAKKAFSWAKACHKKGPKFDEQLAGKTLLRYKGAMAGEIDWRPTETIPEDYYAF